MTAITWKTLLTDWLRRTRELAADLSRPPRPPAAAGGPAARATEYGRIERVVLTDDVSRTLFDEYAGHRATDRGAEETGWVLLGLRRPDEVLVLATLPASTDRNAGVAHVWITGPAHTVASRIVRQDDRRLSILGIVHTHPGTLRHPSAGDLRGDREWVANLRGGEGVFGIGTAGADDGDTTDGVAARPKPHVQSLGGLRFHWYTLGTGDARYRPVPVELTLGPDVAKPLRAVWREVEDHAARLERLATTFARVRFELTEGKHGPALAVVVGLPDPGHAVRVVLEGKDVRYVYEAGGDAFGVDLPDAPPDQGVFLILAEVAARG